MSKYNQSSTWNPANPVSVTPEEYEKHVVSWLRSANDSLSDFTIKHLEYLSGPGGEYEFDGVAQFTAFGGARFTILVECKRYNRPVERDHVMTLWAKLQDVNAQKAMLFATCGFQRGALKYARSKNIATVIFVAGDFLYETKAKNIPPSPPPWISFPKYAGIYTTYTGDSIKSVKIDSENIEVLKDWINKES